jgi:hypothetical protein
MATNTAGNVARLLPFEGMNYLQFTINWNDVSVATGTSVSVYLPKGALISYVQVYIATVFNAGATNAITVGYNASTYNNLVQSGDVNAAIASKSTYVYRGGDLGKLSADQQLFYTYAQTGAAATTGKAYVTVFFSNDNDMNTGT